MAVWQTYGMRLGWWSSSSSTNSNYSSWTPVLRMGTTQNSDTYNPRYPWFNKEEYEKMKKLVDDKGLTWDAATQMLDQLYEYYSPQIIGC